MKIYVKDEDQLGEEFCESVKCSGEQPTESDPTGCCGCDACDKYVEENWERIVSESSKKEFIAVDELEEAITKTILKIRNDPHPTSRKLNWINEGIGIMAEALSKQIKK